ncbi:MAG TPA: DUF2177 family protein [Vicinamibacterales bacterium]|nr:DUF2177 family protein [Vicinamibacterales bacterium]
MTSPLSIAAGVLGFIVLDGIWLGVVMKDFYRVQLLRIGRFAADGTFAPVWPVALLVYVLLGVGVAVFVVPRAHSAPSAAALGALFGLVVYGVYDLTNYSTLAQWPAIVTVADVVWGVAACATVTAAVFLVSSR